MRISPTPSRQSGQANASERLVAAYALTTLVEEHQALMEQVNRVLVDQGYSGDKFALAVWLMLRARVEVIERKNRAFEILPKH